MYKKFLDLLLKITLSFEKLLNLIFSSRNNPLYYHGALPMFMFFTLIVSGCLLWFYYVPTLEDAFLSVKYIQEQIPFGNIIRGLHRYAADAMMLYVLMHMLKVYFTDRYRSHRHLIWFSGVVLLLLVLMTGVSGYQLVWDEKAWMLSQMIAYIFHSMHLPQIAQFLQGGVSVSDFTITTLLFLHVAIPGSIFFFLWIHFLRIKKPVVSTPLSLKFLMLGILLLVTVLWPIRQTLPATIGHLPVGKLEWDWLFLYWIPLVDWLGVGGAVVLHILVGSVFFSLPYLLKELRRNVAKVNVARCVGCRLCAIDCPYNAITMIPKSGQGNTGKLLAVVNRKRCAECGICVGACAFDALDLMGWSYKTKINHKLEKILKVPVVD